MDETERRAGESFSDWSLRLQKQKRTRLQAEVERLRGRIAELAAENAALRAMIATLAPGVRR